jgi:hypothetical protein
MQFYIRGFNNPFYFYLEIQKKNYRKKILVIPFSYAKKILRAIYKSFVTGFTLLFAICQQLFNFYKEMVNVSILIIIF